MTEIRETKNKQIKILNAIVAVSSELVELQVYSINTELVRLSSQDARRFLLG